MQHDAAAAVRCDGSSRIARQWRDRRSAQRHWRWRRTAAVAVAGAAAAAADRVVCRIEDRIVAGALQRLAAFRLAIAHWLQHDVCNFYAHTLRNPNASLLN